MALQTAKDILARVLYVPASGIADDAVIADIKPLDSLAFEALMLELDEHGGREVDPTTLIDIKTVRDLARLLEGLKQTS